MNLRKWGIIVLVTQEPIRPKYKNCHLCGKSLKGHSGYRPCESKKRNTDNIKKVLIYLEKLFI